MKNLLVGLLLALTPSVALAESKGQEAARGELQDLGALIMGHTVGCGEADYDNIQSSAALLSRLYGLLNEDSISDEDLLEMVQTELATGVDFAKTVISEEGCFQFNKYVVQARYGFKSVDDVFTLYVPTSGV